ncbi:MAG: 3-oxoacyl-[acyl-carrier-protein] synthase 3 [Phycisphaerae bacterium]|nr:MAG: 3-oxoacyl-[acyl-carrier-protein] synthase 3 [Phycisphaerae bacterium]
MTSLITTSTTSQSAIVASRPLPAALCAIAGLGHYLPDRIITNDELAQTVDTSDQWIMERTGISGRRCAAPEEATSDMAHRAALEAMADAGVTAEDLDLILLATSTPDTPVPSTACYLQARLGCGGVPAMDIAAGCSGFGFALQMAAASVKSGLHRTVLVVGADTLTRITNYADRQSCILFGDGAGAAVVAPTGRFDVIYSSIGSDGSGTGMIRVRAGGSRTPASLDSVATAGHTLELHGREVFKAAVLRMSDCIRKAASAIGVRPGDFDLVIPHQANARIIEAVGRQLDVPPERLLSDIRETGNTAAASIPIALGRADRASPLAPGKLVCIVGFGAGLAWACQVLLVRDR